MSPAGERMASVLLRLSCPPTSCHGLSLLRMHLLKSCPRSVNPYCLPCYSLVSWGNDVGMAFKRGMLQQWLLFKVP